MKKLSSLFFFSLETDKRIYGLDIMRSAAVLLVMISHLRPVLGLGLMLAENIKELVGSVCLECWGLSYFLF